VIAVKLSYVLHLSSGAIAFAPQLRLVSSMSSTVSPYPVCINPLQTDQLQHSAQKGIEKKFILP